MMTHLCSIQRRALLGLLTVYGLVFASSPLTATTDSVDRAPVDVVTVFLVRHAEKTTQPTKDPLLTDIGETRARDLADLLGHVGVTHLFASEYQRTQRTLAPLAKACQRTVQVVSARKPAEQIKKLQELPAGSVAVVAGHSNTIPSLIQALGGAVENLQDTEHGPMLGESEYDRLFVVILQGPSRIVLRTLELRYGAQPTAR